MAKDKSRKQKRQKQVKIKRKRQTERNSPEGLAKRGAGGELANCQISSDWPDTLKLTQIAIARQIGPDQYACALFLVDRASLGIKSGYIREMSWRDYSATLVTMNHKDSIEPCEPELAAKVLQVSRDYARGLGFEPDPDAIPAMKLLDDIDPQACHDEVRVGGPDGKPLYIKGPYDDSRKIMNRLQTQHDEDK